ncbi:hypothetical protein [Virgibacillus siamensis]|uniref:hypothetical protein n=1 Tax=Virgibacillus siamensis TaxID=480071 RepID=UPI000984FD1C|nr:hypothetical protein [Virgibacillus siamensis]
MNNWLYILYACVLGVLSIFTGEMVTFVMLGFILITLQNVNMNLKRIYRKLPEKSNTAADEGGNAYGNN